METPSEMRMKIVGKATEDADFRARLLGDPKGAIGQELGVSIPASMSIKVHEDSGTTAHLVLPPDSRLSEADLQMATGGGYQIDVSNVDYDEGNNNMMAFWGG